MVRLSFAAVCALACSVALLVPAVPAAAQTPVSFTLGTHNMLHGKATPHRFADVIGWQEADGGRRKLSRLSGYRTYAPNDVPISWRTSMWSLVDRGMVRTHRGKPHVSPHRYITWVKLRHKRTGTRATFLNTHFVSGAWNRNRYERAESWRRTMWHRHDRAVRSLVWRFAQNQERVFLTGDINRMWAPSYPCLRVADAGGIDRLYRSTSSRLQRREVLPRWGSDHRAERVRVRVH